MITTLDSRGRREATAEPLNVLTPQQAARYVGVSEAALRLWRSRGVGPRHFKAGEKLIRYRRCDLDAWIESRLSEFHPPEVDLQPASVK
jgi:predicted DNA-binding transcriptional regulator AlpA